MGDIDRLIRHVEGPQFVKLRRRYSPHHVIRPIVGIVENPKPIEMFPVLPLLGTLSVTSGLVIIHPRLVERESGESPVR